MLRSTAVIVALLVGAVCPSAYAAEVKIQGPAQVPVGGLCIVTVDGLAADDSLSWVAVPELPVADLLDRNGRPVLLVPTNSAGVFHLVLAFADEGKVRQVQHTVTVGGTPPVPPGPGPGPGPQPPLPVVEGKRAVLIIRETADSTPAIGRAVTALRNPPHSEYLKSKGHTLSILDDDSVGPDGKPAPAVEAWRPQFAGMTLPVVFIIDQATNTLVHKESMADLTADKVMDLLKKNGG